MACTQQSGTRINYRGPYSVCCGFLDGSLCVPGSGQTDCPIEESFVASVTKPFARSEFGNYEATLSIFVARPDGTEDEVMCVIMPLVYNSSTWANALGEYQATHEQQQLHKVQQDDFDSEQPVSFVPQKPTSDDAQKVDAEQEVLLLGV
jgi:hypothetical protein